MLKVKVRWGPQAAHAQVGEMSLPAEYELVGTPSDDDDQPALLMKFAVVDGVPLCVEVTRTATAHGRDVRRSDLAMPLEDHLEFATQWVAALHRPDHDQSGDIEFPIKPFVAQLREARRSSYRRGPSDEDLLQAAEVYTSAEKAPTNAVAGHFDIAHRTASLWIARAREKGYLS